MTLQNSGWMGLKFVKYIFENFVFDTARHELIKDGVECTLEPQVFDLLKLLIESREHLVTKDDIVEHIWGGRAISESSISTRINLARAALDDSGKTQRLIKTVHNKGYRFIGEVTVIDPTAPSNVARTSAENKPPNWRRKWAIGAAGILAVIFGYILLKPYLGSNAASTPEFSEKTNIDSAPENTARGYSLNPNIIPDGKADNFDILEFDIGQVLDGGDGIDTLDLSGYSDNGFFVGLFAEKARDQKYKEGEGEYSVVAIENIIGTPQADIFRGSIYPNVIHGGGGDDRLFGYGDRDVIHGGPGNDYINGGYDIDEIFGGPGDDIILVATVSRGDNIDGGDGIDTFDLSKFTASPYNVNLADQSSRELSDRGVDIYTLVNIENVIGTNLNDIFVGDARDNIFTGGGGNDEIDGGAGEDIAVYQGEQENYIITVNADGSLKITDKFGYDGIDQLSNIESIKFSGSVLSAEALKADAQ